MKKNHQKQHIKYKETATHTSNHDYGALLGFIGWVAAHTVVGPFVITLHILDSVCSSQLLALLEMERLFILNLEPCEADGRGASLNSAHETQLLAFRDVPRVWHRGKVWL